MGRSHSSSAGKNAVYQKVVQRYRVPIVPPEAPRTTPWGVEHEHPAPAWVFELVRDVLRYTGAEPDFGEALVEACLAWCEQGDRESRSMELRAHLRSMHDVSRAAALWRFLAAR